MVQLHLYSQTHVSGKVNGQAVDATLPADTSKAFFLGREQGRDVFVAIGCDDGKLGTRFHVLGPALVYIGGRLGSRDEGTVLSEVTVDGPNGDWREQNQLKATYEPGILSFFGLRK